MKRKEWWIAFGGDPSNDKETYKRYVGQWPHDGERIPGEDIIHVIEIEPSERLFTKADILQAFGYVYTLPGNTHKVLDSEIGIALADHLFARVVGMQSDGEKTNE